MKYAKPVSDFARYISDFCYLTRRGCFQVRLSERIFNKLFEVIEE